MCVFYINIVCGQNGSIMEFIYNNSWRRENVEEKSDRNFIGKRRVREENGNYGIQVLACNNLPDFYQVKIIGPDCIRTGRGGEKLIRVVVIILSMARWRNFVEFYARSRRICGGSWTGWVDRRIRWRRYRRNGGVSGRTLTVKTEWGESGSLGGGYWNMGMKEGCEQGKKMSQQIERLARLIRVQRVSLSVNANHLAGTKSRRPVCLIDVV